MIRNFISPASILVVALFLLCWVPGCSFGPIKGYSGEELPRSRLSLVSLPRVVYELEHYARGSTVEHTVNGSEVPPAGVLLQPGTHTFALHYLHGIRGESCVPLLSSDWLQHQWDWRYGTYRNWPNPYFYSQYIESACRIRVHEVTCSGSFVTAAGKTYGLELKVEGEESAPKEVFLVEHQNAQSGETVGTCISGAPSHLWVRPRF